MQPVYLQNHLQSKKDPVMQSQFESLAETALNTGSGFAIAWLLYAWMLPLYGYPVTGSQSFQITAIFTLISVIRSYAWRRVFNRLKEQRQ
jgi:hypothetical protein